MVLITLSFLLMGLDVFHLLSLPKKYALSVLTPFEYGFYTIYKNTSSSFSFLTFWKSGYREIDYLKQRNLELTVDAVQARRLREENEILKSQFATGQVQPEVFLPAQVTGYNRYLFINKGKKDGVKTGQIAVLNTVLVGRVLMAEDNSSKIILPVDPEEKISAITTTNHSKGIVKGAFSVDLVLDDVLSADKLDPEETIETYGQENIPSGLVIGKIKEVQKSESAIFQKAKAKPLIEYGKLRMVFIKIK